MTKLLPIDIRFSISNDFLFFSRKIYLPFFNLSFLPLFRMAKRLDERSKKKITNCRLVTAKQYKHFWNGVLMFNHSEQKRVFVQSFHKGLSVNKAPLRLSCVCTDLYIVSKHSYRCLKSSDRLPIIYFMITMHSVLNAGQVTRNFFSVHCTSKIQIFLFIHSLEIKGVLIDFLFSSQVKSILSVILITG